MSSPNNPHGCFPLGTGLAGGSLSIDEFSKPATDAQAIFRYDPVIRVTGGAVSAAGITPGTSLYSGVALNYGAASTATTHSVVISPDALYEVMSDGTGVLATQIGQNANLALNAGDALTKKSGAVISTASVAVTGTLDLHLLGLYLNADNAFGQYSRIEVVFNKQRMYGGVAGV